MKAIYKHIAFAALALSAVACSQYDDFAPSYLSDPDAVRITAQVGTNDIIGGFTRSNPLGDATTQTQFNTGDRIAVTAGSQAAVTYQLNTDGWKPTGETYLKWKTETMDVTAYYPVGKNDASATTFTVPEVYTDLQDVANADYMTYSGEQTKGTDNSISLAMQRKMVRIVIGGMELKNQFCDENGNPLYSVTAIAVHGNTKGYTDGAPAAGDVAVTAYKHTDGTFYALLAPTTSESDKTFLTITIKHNTKTDDVQTITCTGIPATEAGKSYDYTLTVGKDVASIGSVSVTPWMGGTIPGGEAKEILPPTVEKSGNTAIITMPEATLTDYVTKAVEDAIKDGATTIVVSGNVSDEYYSSAIADARSGAAVYFKDLTTNNYISAAGNTYTCTVGSESEDKYVLIVNELKSYQDTNGLDYSDCIKKLEEFTPGARVISKSETAWEQYFTKIKSDPPVEFSYWVLAENKRGMWSVTSNEWTPATWSDSAMFTDKFYWYPVFDVPLN